MHHGYYPAGGKAKSNQEAQVDMVEEVLAWAGVSGAREVWAAPATCCPDPSWL